MFEQQRRQKTQGPFNRKLTAADYSQPSPGREQPGQEGSNLGAALRIIEKAGGT